MVLEQIVEGLSAAKRKVGRLGQYAVLGLTLAFGACGDDGNVPADSGEEETCEIRETEGCEDFTGLYKITNFEEFLPCTTSGYLDPDDRDDGSWVRGEYFSFYSCGDCKFMIINHALPVSLDSHGYENVEGLGKRGGVLAKGNHILYEIATHFQPHPFRQSEIIECGDQLIFHHANEDFENPPECLAKAIFQSPDYYPYEHFEELCRR